MGFKNLRVINQDAISAGMGFEAHPHRDMEIITLVTHGALEHKDSMGNRSIIRPGEIQVMSAGTGIIHSEWNHHKDQPTKLYQIWIRPTIKDLTPRYAQIDYVKLLTQNGLSLLAAQKSKEAPIDLNARANIYLGRWNSGVSGKIELSPNCAYWLQMVSGKLSLSEERIEMSAGDGLSVENQEKLSFQSVQDSEFIWFELLN